MERIRSDEGSDLEHKLDSGRADSTTCENMTKGSVHSKPVSSLGEWK